MLTSFDQISYCHLHACTNHTGHNAAGVHPDSHVNIQIIALRSHLANIANHSQSQIDATLRMMLILRFRNAGHTVVAIAQKFYSQHIELFRCLIEFDE